MDNTLIMPLNRSETEGGIEEGLKWWMCGDNTLIMPLNQTVVGPTRQ